MIATLAVSIAVIGGLLGMFTAFNYVVALLTNLLLGCYFYVFITGSWNSTIVDPSLMFTITCIQCCIFSYSSNAVHDMIDREKGRKRL